MSSRRLEVASHAKVNLHLQVIGRRADGYHELRTIFQEVDLADELAFELGPPGVRLAVTGARLSAGPENLAHRAATGYLARWGRGAGVSIELRKRIPLGGGLGGGSSNAAAVLLALQRLFGEPRRPTSSGCSPASWGPTCPSSSSAAPPSASAAATRWSPSPICPGASSGWCCRRSTSPPPPPSPTSAN